MQDLPCVLIIMKKTCFDINIHPKMVLVHVFDQLLDVFRIFSVIFENVLLNLGLFDCKKYLRIKD